MSEHTPGPWDAKGNAVYAAHKCIATTEGFRITTRDADTRLIAAAPDMLEALRTLLAHYELFVGPDDDIANAVIKLSTAAIAKAEGRS